MDSTSTTAAAAVEVKDLMDVLRDENRLLYERLCFAQKCVQLCEDYRNCLIRLAGDCHCGHTFDHQMTVNRLEDQYHKLRQQDIDVNRTADDYLTSVSFNKNDNQKITTASQQMISLIDKPFESIGDEINDTNDENVTYNNFLVNKFSKRLETVAKHEDYRLICLNADIEGYQQQPQQYRCNWFKCGQTFGSLISLSQHRKTTHFKVTKDWADLSPILQLDDEIIIDANDRIQHNSRSHVTSRPVMAKEFVCDWIGCHLEFRTIGELRRHQQSIHRCVTQPTTTRANKFVGFKPLTIHTLDDDYESVPTIKKSKTCVDKRFKCNSCDRSYSRKDTLQYHQTVDHNTGRGAIPIHYCQHCEYSTRNVGHLKRHVIRKHSSEKPYRCSLTGCQPHLKQFATLEQLKNHQIKIHSV